MIKFDILVTEKCIIPIYFNLVEGGYFGIEGDEILRTDNGNEIDSDQFG